MEKIIDLNKLFTTEVKQMQFLARVALTYRLSLASLSELLNMDEDTIYKKIRECNTLYNLDYNSLAYLFGNDSSDQIVAKFNFVVLYRNLLNAMKLGDNKKITKLLAPIMDAKAIELMRSRQKDPKKLQNRDYLIMLDYQLKYALRSKQISLLFYVSPSYYQKKISLLIADKPDLKQKYENLVEYNLDLRGKRNGI